MSRSLNIGFLGLGAMGLGMAARLVKAGYEVSGFDVNPEAMKLFARNGGKCAETPREAVARADVLVVVVATSDQASLVLFDDEQGALAGLRNEAVILSCITATPEYVVETKKRLENLGRSDVKLIDCPISGGANRAWQGSLSLLLAGESEDINSIREVLDCLGSKLYIIPGGIGAGSSVKMVHQVLVGVHILASVETMGLAYRAGLDLQSTYDVVMNGDGCSWLFGQRAAHIIDAQRVPASSLMIITKDFAMLNAAARKVGIVLPLATLTHQLFIQAIASGCNSNDDCNVLKVYLQNADSVEDMGKTQPVTKPETSLVQSDISRLLIGIHTAVAIEVLEFAKTLKLDLNVLNEIVKDAAGSSTMFSKICNSSPLESAEALQNSITPLESMRQDMMPALDAAERLEYPLFLSTAALQRFNKR